MQIEPVPAVPGLYLVHEAYDTALLAQFLAEPLPAQHATLDLQETLPRRTFREFEHATWTQLLASQDQAPLEMLGWRINSSVYWIDSPGFRMGIHADNARVQAAMQIYLGNGQDLGTRFYDQDHALLFTVPYAWNCGYIMINYGQLHAAPYVMQGQRCSIYTWLEPKY